MISKLLHETVIVRAFAIIAAGLLTVSLFGCNTNTGTGDASSDISTDPVSTQKATEPTSQATADYTAAPSAKLIENDAKVIIKNIIPVSAEFYGSVFNGGGAFQADKNVTIPGYENYILVVDDKVKSIADLKAWVEDTLTPEVAETRFYSRYLKDLDKPLSSFDPNDYTPLYYDYDGKLYVDSNNGGHGFAFDWDYNSIKIIELNDNSITATIDRLLFNKYDETSTIELVKKNNKWLISNDFIDHTTDTVSDTATATGDELSTASVDRPSIVSAGLYHTAVVKADGSLWVWGWNQHGQVGNGISGIWSDAYGFYDQIQTTPEKVMDSVLSICAGAFNTMAIKSDRGSLWAWGEASFGAIGDGSGYERDASGSMITDHRAEPSQTMVTGVSAVSVGHGYAMAITDGSLWAWGFNNAGQLGDGSTEERISPVFIMDSAIAVATGDTFALALKMDGSLWAWGDNSQGQLGDGKGGKDGDYNATPQKIMDSVAVISAGGHHAMAIKTDGSLWAWGYNYVGQLGDGTTNDKNTPVKIMDSVTAVSSGGSHTMAIKTDGSLWAWGDNGNGEIGNGAGGNPNINSIAGDYEVSPVKIMDSVTAVSAGGFHSIAIKTDGTLWAWGDNTFGQLGDGTQTERHSPIKIMDGVSVQTD